MKDLPLEDWMTLKDFCEKYSHITSEGSLRWMLYHSKENNSNDFVRRMGKVKMLISPTLFFKWLENNKR